MAETAIRDFVRQALQQLGVLAVGSTPSATDLHVGVETINRILDDWNVEPSASYNTEFESYTLTPSLQPHTIGPTGTFVVTTRPTSIQGANLILPGNLTIRTDITIRDDEWWLNNRVRDLTTSIPTDLWYSPDWPNGGIYLWPVPNTAYGIELESRFVLTDLTINSVITLPQGYHSALLLTLAEELSGPFKQPIPPNIVLKAAQARGRIFANNDSTPRLRTMDAGMPGGKGVGYFDYRTGRMRP